MNVILSDILLLTAIARNIENLSLKSENSYGSNDSSYLKLFPLQDITLMHYTALNKNRQLEIMFFKYTIKDILLIIDRII